MCVLERLFGADVHHHVHGGGAIVKPHSCTPSLTSAITTVVMAASVWGRMPWELVDKVLLFLPFASQVRFRSVCKRWRQLFTNSKHFQEESALTALRHGCSPAPGCMCRLKRTRHDSKFLRKWFKLRKLHFPGLVLPAPDQAALVCSEAVPMVALLTCKDWPQDDKRSGAVRLWLLNLARRTWRELPPLTTKATAWELSDFSIRLVRGKGADEFKVLAMRPQACAKVCAHGQEHARIDVFSFTDAIDAPATQSVQKWHPSGVVATNTVWCRSLTPSPTKRFTVTSGGRYVVYRSCSSDLGRVRRLELTSEGDVTSLEALPAPPLLQPGAQFQVFCEGCNNDAIFACGCERHSSRGERGLYMYEFDESTWTWKCLLSQQFPPDTSLSRQDMRLMVWKGQVVGDDVLMAVCVWKKNDSLHNQTWVMDYHRSQGICTWLSSRWCPIKDFQTPYTTFLSPATATRIIDCHASLMT